ncbi:MAG: hypothetical protein K0S65_3941 [Labilithrix sp.]|nr:hypothetical protein [Labilithrix sp.]
MSDPRRYLHDEKAPPLARTLLGSASGDGLDEAQMAALARVLEVDAAVVATAPAGRKLLSRVPAAPAAAAVTTVAIAVAVAYGSFFGQSASSSLPASTTRYAPTATVPAIVDRPVIAPVGASVPEAVSVNQLPEAPGPAAERVASVASVRSPVTPAPSVSDDLAAEVRALEAVRAAIAQRRIAGARAGLASYDHAFPKKILANEARVLEIELLLADGRRDDAEARANTFQVSSANSPYAARVRSLIGASRLP